MADLKSYIDSKFTRPVFITALAMSTTTYVTPAVLYGWTLPAGCLAIGSLAGREIQARYKQIFKVLPNGSLVPIKNIDVAPTYVMPSNVFDVLQNTNNLKSYIDSKVSQLKPIIEDVAFGRSIRVASYQDMGNERNKYYVARYELEPTNANRWCHIRPLMYKLFGENVWRI